MSDKTGDESGYLSGCVDRWLCNVFISDYRELPPGEQYRIAVELDFWVRKSAHLFEYAVLGIVLYLTAEAVSESISARLRAAFFCQSIWKKLPAAGSVVIGFLQAAADELHQNYIAGRNPQMKDVLLDVLGVCAGVAVAMCFISLVRRHREMKGAVRL